MTDIVERLRWIAVNLNGMPDGDAVEHAAFEIERLRSRVNQLKELDDLSRKEIEGLTQKVLLLERVGQRVNWSYDDLENRKEELREENERLREALREYACDCETKCHHGMPADMCGWPARSALGEEK